MDAGEVMRTAREAAGISLSAMAKATGYSKSYLGLVETGRKPVQAWHVEAYERVLGVDVDRLAQTAQAPRTVDAQALEDLSSILSATRRLEDLTGAACVLPTVRGLTVLSHTLAKAARGALAEPSLAVASEVSQYRGWLEHTTGSPRGARTSLDLAIKLGMDSAVADRLSQGLSFRGYVDLAAGPAAQAPAADYTDAAMRVRGVHPALHVYNLYQRARVHARAGELRRAQEVLAEADKAAELLTEPPPEAGYWYSAGFWGLQRGRILHVLGQLDLALAEMRAAIAAMPAEQRGAEWLARWVRAVDGDGVPPGE